MPADDSSDPHITVKDRRRFTSEGEAKPETESAPTPERAQESRPPEGTPPGRGTSGGDGLGAQSRGESGAGAAEHLGSAPDSVPKIDFAGFIMGVAQLALMYLGHSQGPGKGGEAGRPQVNIGLARQQIDLLALLMEKTRGNLTAEESGLLGSLLYELRMLYVDATRRKGGPSV